MTAEFASAWVESPLQLLCAVEHAFASGREVRIVPRAGSAQLQDTADRLRELGLPSGVRIERARALPALASAHWVVGDAFSGMTRSAIALRMPQRLTIVDDGSATLGLPAVLDGTAPLTRPTDTPAARYLGELVATRLRELASAGRVELFTYYPLAHPARRVNRFAWLTSRGLSSAVSGRVVLGSAAVADGLMALPDYRAWLASIDAPYQYFPHRREDAATFAHVAGLAGVTVATPGLPIELVLAGASALEVLSLPSSAIESLRIILDGSGSTLSVHERLVAA
jgi:hypothetical protein